MELAPQLFRDGQKLDGGMRHTNNSPNQLMTNYQNPRELIAQRQALLQAVTVLWENDHQDLAQQLWNVGYQLKARRVLLPGEQ